MACTPCQHRACPVNVWAEHFLEHNEKCGQRCPALICMDEHEVCNNHLFHVIGHFADNLPQPEKLLDVLVHRPWLPTAYPEALKRLWRARKALSTKPSISPFNIATTTKSVLAVGQPVFAYEPQGLLPVLQEVCQPELAIQAEHQLEMLQCLLSSRGQPWPASLLAVITAAIQATPPGPPSAVNAGQPSPSDSQSAVNMAPPASTTEAVSAWHERQQKIVALLLDHCCEPPTPQATIAPSINKHIQTAIVAGASAGLLALLLNRAPRWTPDDLRMFERHGGVLYPWIREMKNYQELIPVIAKAAVSRQAAHQLMSPLMYLAAPFQRGVAANDHDNYEQKLMTFLQTLASLHTWISPNDFTVLLKHAVTTRNSKLLEGFASTQFFRWPTNHKHLGGFVCKAASGMEEFDLAVVQQLLLLASEPWDAEQIGFAVRAAYRGVVSKGITQRMCDVLTSNGANWKLVAATAAALKYQHWEQVVDLLTKLYGGVGDCHVGLSTEISVLQLRLPPAVTPAMLTAAAAGSLFAPSQAAAEKAAAAEQLYAAGHLAGTQVAEAVSAAAVMQPHAVLFPVGAVAAAKPPRSPAKPVRKPPPRLPINNPAIQLQQQHGGQPTNNNQAVTVLKLPSGLPSHSVLLPQFTQEQQVVVAAAGMQQQLRQPGQPSALVHQGMLVNPAAAAAAAPASQAVASLSRPGGSNSVKMPPVSSTPFSMQSSSSSSSAALPAGTDPAASPVAAAIVQAASVAKDVAVPSSSRSSVWACPASVAALQTVADLPKAAAVMQVSAPNQPAGAAPVLTVPSEWQTAHTSTVSGSAAPTVAGQAMSCSIAAQAVPAITTSSTPAPSAVAQASAMPKQAPSAQLLPAAAVEAACSLLKQALSAAALVPAAAPVPVHNNDGEFGDEDAAAVLAELKGTSSNYNSPRFALYGAASAPPFSSPTCQPPGHSTRHGGSKHFTKSDRMPTSPVAREAQHILAEVAPFPVWGSRHVQCLSLGDIEGANHSNLSYAEAGAGSAVAVQERQSPAAVNGDHVVDRSPAAMQQQKSPAPVPLDLQNQLLLMQLLRSVGQAGGAAVSSPSAVQDYLMASRTVADSSGAAAAAPAAAPQQPQRLLFGSGGPTDKPEIHNGLRGSSTAVIVSDAGLSAPQAAAGCYNLKPTAGHTESASSTAATIASAGTPKVVDVRLPAMGERQFGADIQYRPQQQQQQQQQQQHSATAVAQPGNPLGQQPTPTAPARGEQLLGNKRGIKHLLANTVFTEGSEQPGKVVKRQHT